MWAAGVGAAEAVAGWGLPQGQGGRILVGSDLRVQGQDRIFAVGDIADNPDDRTPQLAQPALRESGATPARSPSGCTARPLPEPFTYHDKGMMATIGRRSAVVQLAQGPRLRGTLAWLSWLVLHLFSARITTSSASAQFFQDLGFSILNDIVWRKANPMPNFRGRRFTNAHETMIWAARGPEAKAYTFNYEILKAGNDDCQARSDWFLPICTGAERLKDRGGQDRTRRKSPRLCCARVAGGLERGAIWCSTRSSARGRPARCAKTPPLLHRHRARSGLRRCGAQADRGGRVPRRGGGRNRADEAQRAARRLCERHRGGTGCAPGEQVVDVRRRALRALVRADGALSAGPAVGSIHKIGALVQGLPACNGWTFWHVERAGRLTPIDDLRAGMRALMREAAE